MRMWVHVQALATPTAHMRPLVLPPHDSPLWLLLSALAVWRLTALLCYEAGPFDLALRCRRLLGRVGLGRILSCFHCCAFWMSVVVVGGLYNWTVRVPLAIVAVSGAVSIVERWLRGDIAEERNDE